ncbi:hypothetical protein KW783_00360, partial [Candidatus Parcubacteria bacterium]|nr:hypothetical protein [Candidatus Parcubacteria bacterium]
LRVTTGGITIAGGSLVSTVNATNTFAGGLTLGGNGLAVTGAGALTVSSVSTSTFANGLILNTGCVYMTATASCLGSGSGSGTVNSGTTNRLSYYSGATTLDSALFLAVNTSTGLFGIGSSSPAARLSVANGAGAITPAFLVSTTTAGNATSTAFIIDSQGRVGIGNNMTAPTALLSISGGTASTSALKIDSGAYLFPIQAGAFEHVSGKLAFTGSDGFRTFLNARTATTTASTSVATWTVHQAPEANNWTSVAWSPELGILVAVSSNGTNRVMTSPDGITWTPRTAAAQNSWNSVTWSPQLGIFVAVASNGANQVMTSSDGITWTGYAASDTNVSWKAIAWSPELGIFVAVEDTGNGEVMTSPNGTSWTTHAMPEANIAQGIAWSPELHLFVVVESSGTNRIATSPDGITWTQRTVTTTSTLKSIVWSPQLGVFVAGSTAGTVRIMPSADGITWTDVTSTGTPTAVAWSSQLGIFVAVGNAYISSSPDGINWTTRTSSASSFLTSITWSPELGIFVAVSAVGNVITSKLPANTASPYINDPLGIARLGLATTTPSARLALAAQSLGVTPLFTVSTSTATATSTAFIIDSNGKVGIGTTSPSTQLAVAGSLLVDGISNASSTIYNGLVVGTGGIRNAVLPNCNTVDTDSAGNFICGVDAGGSATPGGNDGYVQFNVGGAFTGDADFFWNNTTKALGLGSSTPAARLSVANAGASASPAFLVSTSSSGTATSTAFIIDSQGRVGIGTTSPGRPLSVSGSILTTGDLIINGYSTNYSAPLVLHSNNDIADAAWNLGYNNTQTSSGYNDEIVIGNNNTSSNFVGLTVGIANSVPYGEDTIVVGENNQAASSDQIFGLANNTANASGSGRVVFGSGNTANQGTSDNFIFGKFNTVGVGADSAGIVGLSITNNNSSTLDLGVSNATKLTLGLTSSIFRTNIGRGTSTPAALLSLAGLSGATTPLVLVSTTTPGNATSTAFLIDSNGRVGIGTTSQNFQLAVEGSIYASASSTFNNGLDITNGCFSIHGTCLSTTGGSGTINSGTTNRLSYYSGATTLDSALILAVDTTNGYLGIGSSTPLARLSVANAAGVTTPAFLVSTTTSGNATSTAFIIDSSGRVGIGTTSPAAFQLSVAGSVYITGSGRATSTVLGGFLDVQGTTGTSTFASGINVGGGGLLTSGGVTLGGGSLSTINTALTIQPGGSNNILLNPVNTGKVGIGTSTPCRSHKLICDWQFNTRKPWPSTFG